MNDTGQIEVLARGVCVQDGKLLLCRTKGADNTYLPGGHVEFMEKAEDALCREIIEEAGLEISVGRFLGAVEHTFIQAGERHCEINLIFEVAISDIDASEDPVSLEDYIEFCWVSLDKLLEFKLEPIILCDLLASWVDRSGGSGFWSSSYQDG